MSRPLPQTLSATLILCLGLLVTAPARGFLRLSLHPVGLPLPDLSDVATDIDTSTVVHNFARLPLSFVPNAGQTDPAVRFQAYGMAGTIVFTPDEVAGVPFKP